MRQLDEKRERSAPADKPKAPLKKSVRRITDEYDEYYYRLYKEKYEHGKCDRQ